MAEVGSRDRLVMAGLVVLGLLTVVAMRLARRVCTALGESYMSTATRSTTSGSIGIAIGPVDDTEPSDTLLKNADLALYRAKEDGRNTFRFFEPAMDAALQKRRRLEADLRAALRKNQLYLDYQPQFDLDERQAQRLRGSGALVASHRGRDSPNHLHSDRRGDRVDRSARRMDPAHGLYLRDHLAARHQSRGEPLSGAVQDPGRVRSRCAAC